MLSRMRQLCQLCLAVSLPALAGCGGPTVLQCRLDAVEQALPHDPGLVTVDDVIAVIDRLQACKATSPDAGAPP